MTTNGNEIRRRRKAMKLTQHQLAKWLNASQNAISMWEKGHSISRYNANVLADFFNCKVSDVTMSHSSHEIIPQTNVNRYRLRQMRKDKGMSQLELALEAGVCASQISNWENGLQGMSLNSAHKIAAALECKLSDIIIPYGKV